MVYVWVILWVVFALAVFSVLGWTINITLAQNKAWSDFADKYKLTKQPKLKFMDPLAVSGVLHGRRINMYVVSEPVPSRRTTNVYSHIEIFLNEAPKAMMLVGKRLKPMSMSDMSLPHIYNAPGIDWALRETDDVYGMANWMTEARTKALKTYLDSAGPADQPILIADGTQAFLLWRTAAPLKDPRALNALCQRLFGIAKELDGGASMIVKPNASSEPTPDTAPAATA